MPASTVHVQYCSGSPARRHRVVLGFHASGITRAACTNDYGEVLSPHVAVDRATISVSGKAYHTSHAPGRTVATLGR